MKLGKAIQKTGAKYVYVATDGDDMIDKFKKKFKNIEFLKYPSSNPHVDLCIIGKSDHAIINCVSTFSAFAKRQRDSEEKPLNFGHSSRKPKQNYRKISKNILLFIYKQSMIQQNLKTFHSKIKKH